MNSQSNRIVALLPMKANSTRVPGKNFRELEGKPLYRWILDTLLSIDLIDSVVINTDAEPLLKEYALPINERIIIRKRKDDICGDNDSMTSVLRADIENIHAGLYLMTHTTNPFLEKETIVQAIKDFQIAKSQFNSDSLFTVNKMQTRFYKQNCQPVNHDPTNLIPTQNLEPWFEENSNLYLFTKESFLKTNARIGQNPIMYETRKIESIDIDTLEDWEMASMIASCKIK